MVMPRSLNEPVGLRPSYLRNTFTPLPMRSAITGAGISGVAPSRRVITGVLALTGNHFRYPSISPGQSCMAGRRLKGSRGTGAGFALETESTGRVSLHRTA